MGMEKQANYLSFLLRIWRVEEDGGQEWRASLENVGSGEMRGFTSLEELTSYITQLTTRWDENLSEGT